MDALLGLVPFIVILAICPLMMFFMMRTMHHGPAGHKGHVAPLNEHVGADDAARLQALEAEVAMLRGRPAAGAGDRPAAAAEAMTKQPVQQA